MTVDKQPPNTTTLTPHARDTHHPHLPLFPTHLPPSHTRTNACPPPLFSLGRACRPDNPLSVPSPPPLLPNQRAPSPLPHPLVLEEPGRPPSTPHSHHSSPCPLLSPTPPSNIQKLTPGSPAPAVLCAAQELTKQVPDPSGSRRVPRHPSPSFLFPFVSLPS